MGKTHLLLVGLIMGISACLAPVTTGTASAQVPRDRRPEPGVDGLPRKPKPGELEERVMEGEKKEMEKFRKRVEKLGTYPPSPNAALSKDLTTAQKKLLSPTPEDIAKFEDFLKQPDSGLIRLLPKGAYEYSPYVVSANSQDLAKVLPVTGGGAAYSFTKENHELSEWSEIGLEGGKLFSGFAGGVLGFLTNVGDVPIESMTLNSPGVDFLNRLARPKRRAEAIEQSKRNSEGFAAGNFTYKSVLPAVAGSTYVLRSVAEGRADVLIVFRLLRQDEDKSVIMLWKRLKKSSAPMLR